MLSFLTRFVLWIFRRISTDNQRNLLKLLQQEVPMVEEAVILENFFWWQSPAPGNSMITQEEFPEFLKREARRFALRYNLSEAIVVKLYQEENTNTLKGWKEDQDEVAMQYRTMKALREKKTT